jgi:hypothetical protein
MRIGWSKLKGKVRLMSLTQWVLLRCFVILYPVAAIKTPIMGPGSPRATTPRGALGLRDCTTMISCVSTRRYHLIPSYTILYRFWTLSFSRYLFCWLPGSATRTPTPRGAAYKLFICIGGSISVTGKTAIGIEQQRVPFPCARPKNLYSSRAE